MKHPSRGSLDATALSCARLTVPNLQSASTLVKHDKAQFINSYVRSQHAYRKAFESEGREARASWDKEKTGIAETDKPAQVIQNLVFATPVLKARVPEKKTDRPELQATRAHAPGSNIDPNETTEPKTKDKRSIPRRSSPSTRKRTIDDFSTKTKTKTKKWIRATDERKVDADAEREAILAGRRERRRTKKAIVDFKDDGKEVLEDDDSAARTTREKTKKKKKADNSAGLALMHGFTATNVGVSRLTMKPTVGVFTKGKASVRTGVLIKTKHKPPNNVWIESLFLNKGKGVESVSSASSPDLSTTISQQSNARKKRKVEASSRKKRKRESTPNTPDMPTRSSRNQKKHKICNYMDSSKHPQDTRIVAQSKDMEINSPQRTSAASVSEQPSRAESVVWDIESLGKNSADDSTGDEANEAAKLSPTLSSKDRTPILNTRVSAWHTTTSSLHRQHALDSEICARQKFDRPGDRIGDRQEQRCIVHDSPLSGSSLCPSQSASRLVQATTAHRTVQHPPCCSKYFEYARHIEETTGQHDDVYMPGSTHDSFENSRSEAHVYHPREGMEQGPSRRSASVVGPTNVTAELLCGDYNVQNNSGQFAGGASTLLEAPQESHYYDDANIEDQYQALPGQTYQPSVFSDSLVPIQETYEALPRSDLSTLEVWGPDHIPHNMDFDENGLWDSQDIMNYGCALAVTDYGPSDLLENDSLDNADEVFEVDDVPVTKVERKYADSDTVSWSCESVEGPSPSDVSYERPRLNRSTSTSLSTDQSYDDQVLLSNGYPPMENVCATANAMVGNLVLPTLAEVEEDVAKQLRGHWLRQRL